MSDKKLWDHHQDNNRYHLIQWYPRQNRLCRNIKRFLPVGSKLLEIGFGDGYLLNLLSHAGYSVSWQDLSERNIELTKKQWNNKNIDFFLWTDDGKILVADSSLDWFVASEVLEHLWDKELSFCVQEIYRTLKPWWYAFLTVPVRENLQANECICPNCSVVFHKWGHKQCWDDVKIRKEFKKFQIVRIDEFFSRYVWNSTLDNILSYIMFLTRNILDKFTSLDNKSYLLILKKL